MGIEHRGTVGGRLTSSKVRTEAPHSIETTTEAQKLCAKGCQKIR